MNLPSDGFTSYKCLQKQCLKSIHPPLNTANTQKHLLQKDSQTGENDDLPMGFLLKIRENFMSKKKKKTEYTQCFSYICVLEISCVLKEQKDNGVFFGFVFFEKCCAASV